MKPRFSPSCDRFCAKMADRFTSRRYSLKNKLCDRMIKRLLNLVIAAKYRDLSVSRRSIICLGLRLRQMIDLLATDKSRYFTKPHPIIVNSVPFHGYLQVLNYNIPYDRAPHLTRQEQVSLTIKVKYFRNQLVATWIHNGFTEVLNIKSFSSTNEAAL